MNNVYFWRDIYGDLDKFSPYQAKIERLLQGEQAGLRIEKLRLDADPPIYSMRLNESDRLLFSIYQSSLCLLDVVLHHDYAKSMFVRHPHKVQDFVKTMIDCEHLLWEEAAPELPVLLEKPEYRPLDYYQHQFIHLNAAQEGMISTAVPSIVVGPAGSGKTSTAMILLSTEVKAGRGRMLYVTRSQALVSNLHKMWHAHYPEEHQVDFKTYAELSGVDDDKAQFLTWYAERAAGAGGGSALSADIIWQEFRIRGGYADDKMYLSLGERQTSIDLAARRHVCRFYQEYLRFSRGRSSVSSQDLALDYQLVVVDEAQDLSNGQLKNLYRASHGQIIYLLGSHQILFDEVSKLDYLKSLFFNDRVRIFVHHLPICHRSAEHVVEVANGLIHLKAQVTGGASDKTETLMMVAEDLKGQGEFELRQTTAIEDLVGDNPNVAIITLAEWKAEAKAIFNSSLVFTVAEVKGLEFHTVVLWKLLSATTAHELAQCFDHKSQRAGGIHRAKRGQARPEYVNSCDAWITAVTRAQQRVIWLDDSHYKIASIYAYLRKLEQKGEVSLPAPGDWRKVFEDLMAAGNTEQAEEVYMKHLGGSKEGFAALLVPLEKKEVVAARVSYASAYETLKEYLRSKKRLSAIGEVNNLLKSSSFWHYVFEQDDGVALLLAFYASHPKVIPHSIWYQIVDDERTLLHFILAKVPTFAFALMHADVKNIPSEMISVASPHSLHPLLYQTTEGRKLLFDIYANNPKLLADKLEANVCSSKLLCLLLTGARALPPTHKLRKALVLVRLKFDLEQSRCFKSVVEKAYQLRDIWTLGLLAQWGIADQCILEGLLNLMTTALLDNYFDIATVLIQKGANINVRMKSGSTPLILASYRGRMDIVRYLCEQGANKDLARMGDGTTALFFAAAQGNVEMVQYLCEQGANKDLALSDGTTPLFSASEQGNLKMVQCLCELGANKDLPNRDGRTPLFIAVELGILKIVQYLCEQGANKDFACSDGATPLYTAVWKGDIEIVQYLCEQGANMDFAIRDGVSPPLYIAAQQGNLKIVQYLCEQGANMDIVIRDGRTPLSIAVAKGHVAIVQYLCKQGVNWRSTMVDGKSLIDLAREIGYSEIADYLSSLPELSPDVARLGLFGPADGRSAMRTEQAPSP